MCSRYTIHRAHVDFLKEFPVGFCREAIRNAMDAYYFYFKRISKHPSFHRKNDSRRWKYHPRPDKMWIKDNRLRVEGLYYKPNVYSETIKVDKDVLNYSFLGKKFVNPTVTKDSIGNYYISFCIVEEKQLSYFEDNNIPKMDRAIGIDLGLRDNARIVCSDGTRFINPDIRKEEYQLKKLAKRILKDNIRHKNQERNNPGENIEWSKRSQKRKLKSAKYRKSITNKNYTFMHTAAKQIIKKNPLAVVMEGFDCERLFVKNHFMAQMLQHKPIGLIRSVIEKKCNKYGITFIKAKETFPSSQMCSNCGHIRPLDKSTKNFNCPCCGLHIDRDINAALNLEHLAYTVDFTNMSNIDLAKIS